MRSAEREELLGVMEKASKPAVSRTQATLSLGSSGNAFANSTLPSLVHRERTDVLNAKPFEAPEILTLSQPGSPKASRTSLHTPRSSPPGSRPHSPTSRASRPRTTSAGRHSSSATPNKSRSGSPEPRERPGTSQSLASASHGPRSRGNSRPTSASTTAAKVRERARASPADAIQYTEITRLSADAEQPSFAYSFPKSIQSQLEARGSTNEHDMLMSGQRRSTGREAALARRWVHHPLSELWQLSLNSKGLLEWRELEPTGALPFPRSRHTMEAVGSRGLALLFGGRSVHASTVLSDMYCLDVPDAHWTRVNLCGVPPSPRECAAAVVFGASLILFGGRGRTCHTDVAIFHLAAEARSGNLQSAAVTETPGMWEHPHTSDNPSRRQGHAMVPLGSRRMLTLGGYNNDRNTFAPALPVAAEFLPHSKGMSLAVTSIMPTSAGVEGGATLILKGLGFNRNLKYRVRFTVPHAPPPAAGSAGSPGAKHHVPICLADTELFAVVDARVIDSMTLECETPDMSAMLCDGHVLVEAAQSDGGKELWTADEIELMLTSSVDTAKLRLKGPTTGVVGDRTQMVLHTFDHRARRRSTGGDQFTCALRNHGPLPEEGDPTFVTLEEAAHDLGNGTHVLTYCYERAGSFLFTIRLDGKVVMETSITLEACDTSAASCDLNLTPLPKGAAVQITAGDTLSFAVGPRDRFGNTCAHREDAHVSRFSWRLQRLPPPQPKDDDDKADPPPPPPPPAEVVPFETLDGTSMEVTVSGEYELIVTHAGVNGEKVVQGKPMRVAVMPAALSPAHSTLHGSGMYNAWVEGMNAGEREIVLTARDAYGNAIGKALPGLREGFSVQLRNTDTNLTNPMVEITDLGEGQLRGSYGVRLLGHFVLFVELHGETLLRKPLTIGRTSDKPEGELPDTKEIWEVEFSLRAERERLAAIAEEEARLAEEAKQAATAALDAALIEDWQATVSAGLVAAGVPAGCVNMLEGQHRMLRELHAAFSHPPEERPAAGRMPRAAPAGLLNGENAVDDFRAASALPIMSLRGWSLLCKWAGLIDVPSGRTRAHLNTLFVGAYDTASGGSPQPYTEFAGSAHDVASPIKLALPAFGLLLAHVSAPPAEAAPSEAAPAAAPAPAPAAAPAPAPASEAAPAEAPETAEGGDGGGAADPLWEAQLEKLLETCSLCPLIEVMSIAAAEEYEEEEPGRELTVPPWNVVDGGWQCLDEKRAGLYKFFLSGIEGGIEGGGESGSESGGEGGVEGGVQASVITVDQALALDYGYLLGNHVTDEHARELFRRVQAEAIPADAVEGRETPLCADFDEYLTWLWLLCREAHNFVEPGFTRRVFDWLKETLERAPAPAVPLEAPEPKSPGKGKKK